MWDLNYTQRSRKRRGERITSGLCLAVKSGPRNNEDAEIFYSFLNILRTIAMSFVLNATGEDSSIKFTINNIDYFKCQCSIRGMQ